MNPASPRARAAAEPPAPAGWGPRALLLITAALCLAVTVSVPPVPDAYLAGMDHQALEAQPGITPTYFMGRIRRDAVPAYLPVAMAVKWSLATWLALLGAIFVALARRRRGARDDPERGFRRFASVALLSIPIALLGAGIFTVQLNVGVRYLLPALPPLLVLAAGALLGDAAGAGRAHRMAALGIVVVAALEVGGTAPNYLAFFNVLAGGPGNGDRIVNDSNVDLGQGLIALRRELALRGIRRVHLAYHGTTDPAMYGIDYVPYLGGAPGPESDWLAVSSYYFVGLSQRMMTPHGRTPFVQLDFRSFWDRSPAARPGRCMYLFRIR